METINITLDYNAQTQKAPKHWQLCIGSGHAHLAHRFDYIEQLEYCRKELGFESVRFHGIFNDDMNVVTKLTDIVGKNNKNSPREYNFYQIGTIFDRLLKIGIKPFVELSFMPTALASGKKTIFTYKGNVSLPKYIVEWKTLIEKFAQFLIDRYGIQEVSSWNFEVWNEPNLRCFFDGKKEDYFALYRETCLSLKSISKSLKVGGPSTANNEWIEDFIKFCAETDTPLDFVSTHQYPSDALGHSFKNINMLKLQLDKSRSIIDSVHKPIQSLTYDESCFSFWQKGEMTKQCRSTKKIAKDLPLYYTEWNIDSNCMADIHDRIETASFIVKTCLDNQNIIDGSSFWTFSDIFEEVFFFPQPFTGGFGLLNIHGIPKPAFWAFKFLSELGEERLEVNLNNDFVECACFKSKNSVQILFYSQAFVSSDNSAEINCSIKNIGEYKNAEIKAITEESGNPIKVWEQLNSPKVLSREDVDFIKLKSAVSSQPLKVKLDNNELKFSLCLKVNEIVMITINK